MALQCSLSDLVLVYFYLKLTDPIVLQAQLIYPPDNEPSEVHYSAVIYYSFMTQNLFIHQHNLKTILHYFETNVNA